MFDRMDYFSLNPYSAWSPPVKVYSCNCEDLAYPVGLPTPHIRLGMDVIAYFKALAEETGSPYQSLINLYLRDCTATGRKLKRAWQSEAVEI